MDCAERHTRPPAISSASVRQPKAIKRQFGNCRRVIHPHRVGVQFLHHVTHQTAPAHKVAAQLFDELLEPRLAMRAGRLLMRFGNRRADGQEVANEQRQRFDLDVLVALQALGLARQPIQPLGDGRLALVARVRR